MDSRIKRAKMIDQFMTIIFYGIALFFFLLLVGFALVKLLLRGC